MPLCILSRIADFLSDEDALQLAQTYAGFPQEIRTKILHRNMIFHDNAAELEKKLTEFIRMSKRYNDPMRFSQDVKTVLFKIAGVRDEEQSLHLQWSDRPVPASMVPTSKLVRQIMAAVAAMVHLDTLALDLYCIKDDKVNKEVVEMMNAWEPPRKMTTLKMRAARQVVEVCISKFGGEHLLALDLQSYVQAVGSMKEFSMQLGRAAPNLRSLKINASLYEFDDAPVFKANILKHMPKYLKRLRTLAFFTEPSRDPEIGRASPKSIFDFEDGYWVQHRKMSGKCLRRFKCLEKFSFTICMGYNSIPNYRFPYGRALKDFCEAVRDTSNITEICVVADGPNLNKARLQTFGSGPVTKTWIIPDEPIVLGHGITAKDFPFSV